MKKKEVREQGRPRKKLPDPRNISSFKDLGIDKPLSSRAQRNARVPVRVRV